MQLSIRKACPPVVTLYDTSVSSKESVLLNPDINTTPAELITGMKDQELTS